MGRKHLSFPLMTQVPHLNAFPSLCGRKIIVPNSLFKMDSWLHPLKSGHSSCLVHIALGDVLMSDNSLCFRGTWQLKSATTFLLIWCLFLIVGAGNRKL